MAFCTRKEEQTNVSGSVMRIGQKTQTTESRHQGTCLCSVEEQYLGAVRNRNASHCQQLRQSTLYIALSSAAQESVWLRQLLTELGRQSIDYCNDEKPAISWTCETHVEIKHHFIREQVSHGKVQLEYCPTTEMTADILTKGLSHETFCKLRVKSRVGELTN